MQRPMAPSRLKLEQFQTGRKLMPIKTPQARQVCTKTELDLYMASLAREVKKFPMSRLKQKVVRSRKLRDKYRALATQQEREARGKGAPRRRRPAQGAERTRRKEQLFAETLERFDKQLAVLEKTDGAKSAAKQSRIKQAGKKRVQKHASAEGRRRQARRDVR
ncbi:MAG: hypothetical protein ACTSWM_06880 [Alphaproteobacteria bacterium]